MQHKSDFLYCCGKRNHIFYSNKIFDYILTDDTRIKTALGSLPFNVDSISPLGFPIGMNTGPNGNSLGQIIISDSAKITFCFYSLKTPNGLVKNLDSHCSLVSAKLNKDYKYLCV